MGDSSLALSEGVIALSEGVSDGLIVGVNGAAAALSFGWGFAAK